MHFEASDPQFSPVKPLFLKGKRLLLLLALRLGKRKSAKNMRPNIVNFNFGVSTLGELIYPPIDLHLIFEKSSLKNQVESRIETLSLSKNNWVKKIHCGTVVIR